MYSSGLALTLVGMTMVTTLVIMAVTSNVVLSLGMVGALSIVRFRAAIKSRWKLVFLFWSLAAGIVHRRRHDPACHHRFGHHRRDSAFAGQPQIQRQTLYAGSAL